MIAINKILKLLTVGLLLTNGSVRVLAQQSECLPNGSTPSPSCNLIQNGYMTNTYIPNPSASSWSLCPGMLPGDMFIQNWWPGVGTGAYNKADFLLNGYQQVGTMVWGGGNIKSIYTKLDVEPNTTYAFRFEYSSWRYDPNTNNNVDKCWLALSNDYTPAAWVPYMCSDGPGGNYPFGMPYALANPLPAGFQLIHTANNLNSDRAPCNMYVSGAGATVMYSGKGFAAESCIFTTDNSFTGTKTKRLWFAFSQTISPHTEIYIRKAEVVKIPKDFAGCDRVVCPGNNVVTLGNPFCTVTGAQFRWRKSGIVVSDKQVFETIAQPGETYELSMTIGSCTVKDVVQIVSPIDGYMELPRYVCPGGKETLTAINCDSACGAVVKWYDQSDPLTVLGTGTSFVTPRIFSNRVFVAKCVYPNGCVYQNQGFELRPNDVHNEVIIPVTLSCGEMFNPPALPFCEGGIYSTWECASRPEINVANGSASNPGFGGINVPLTTSNPNGEDFTIEYLVFDANGCAKCRFIYQIHLLPMPTHQVNITICRGQTVNLEPRVDCGSVTSISPWRNDQTGLEVLPIITPDQSGTYTSIQLKADGCVCRTRYNVTVTQPPLTTENNETTLMISCGTVYNLNSDNNCGPGGIWENITDGQTELNPLVKPLKTTTYVYITRDANGCITCMRKLNLVVNDLVSIQEQEVDILCNQEVDLSTYDALCADGNGVWEDEENEVVLINTIVKPNKDKTYRKLKYDANGCTICDIRIHFKYDRNNTTNIQMSAICSLSYITLTSACPSNSIRHTWYSATWTSLHTEYDNGVILPVSKASFNVPKPTGSGSYWIVTETTEGCRCTTHVEVTPPPTLQPKICTKELILSDCSQEVDLSVPGLLNNLECEDVCNSTVHGRVKWEFEDYQIIDNLGNRITRIINVPENGKFVINKRIIPNMKNGSPFREGKYNRIVLDADGCEVCRVQFEIRLVEDEPPVSVSNKKIYVCENPIPPYTNVPVKEDDVDFICGNKDQTHIWWSSKSQASLWRTGDYIGDYYPRTDGVQFGTSLQGKTGKDLNGDIYVYFYDENGCITCIEKHVVEFIPLANQPKISHTLYLTLCQADYSQAATTLINFLNSYKLIEDDAEGPLTYVWSEEGGGPITYITNQIFNYRGLRIPPGGPSLATLYSTTYHRKAYNRSGCLMEDLTIKFVTAGCKRGQSTGLPGFSVNDDVLGLYPNPSSGKIIVSGLQSGDVERIKILDVLGIQRNIAIRSLSGTTCEIELENNASGCYFLIVTRADGTKEELRFVITNQ